MLKRYQILLNDWLAEHLRLIAQRNDLSFSEMTRIVLCEGLLHTCPTLHPEYKSKIKPQELSNLAKEGYDPETALDRKHQLASKLYFEARKAIEYMNAKVNKELKNKH